MLLASLTTVSPEQPDALQQFSLVETLILSLGCDLQFILTL